MKIWDSNKIECYGDGLLLAAAAEVNREAEPRGSRKPGHSNADFTGIIYVFDIKQQIFNESVCSAALNCGPGKVY